MKLGKRSVWAPTDGFNAQDLAAFAQRLEGWGYSALWIPDAMGRDPLVAASWILANTKDLIVATGIANIYSRDASTMRAGQIALNEQSGGRFLLGLGVSHQPFVEGVRGHDYLPPVPTMRNYLERMKAQQFMGQPAPEEPLTVIAALGPKMLELAGTVADGAHPYLVPPEHTAQARDITGPDALLCVEQKVIFETNPDKARGLAREMLQIYLPLPNYRNNLLRCGYTEDDCESGGSDRLVDGIIAWGDEKAIAERLQAHEDAGATQVCIQALGGKAPGLPDERILEALAPNA